MTSMYRGTSYREVKAVMTVMTVIAVTAVKSVIVIMAVKAVIMISERNENAVSAAGCHKSSPFDSTIAPSSCAPAYAPAYAPACAPDRGVYPGVPPGRTQPLRYLGYSGPPR